MITIVKKKIERKQKTKENKTSQNNIPAIFGYSSLIVIVLLGVVGLILSQPIEVEMIGKCNSGNVGIDIQTKNMIQPRICQDWVAKYDDNGNRYIEFIEDPENINMTCYKEDLLLDHVDLRGLQDLECSGKVKTKMPFILGMFMNFP